MKGLCSRHTAVHIKSAVASSQNGTTTTAYRTISSSPGNDCYVHSDVKLLVCDMAGTTVKEGGIVYLAIQSSLKSAGIDVSLDDLKPWRGAQKSEVIRHFVSKEVLSRNLTSESLLDTTATHVAEDVTSKFVDDVNHISAEANAVFAKTLIDTYTDPTSPIDLIHPELPDFFTELRKSGVKVALNTGYPVDIQEALVKRFGFDELVDGYISAQQVTRGRPAPFMIQKLMQDLEISSASHVAKIGDTKRDIEEGKVAGCIDVIGTLSGADDEVTLRKAGATMIVQNVVDLRFRKS